MYGLAYFFEVMKNIATITELLSRQEPDSLAAVYHSKLVATKKVIMAI
jgi:hypothetical protein